MVFRRGGEHVAALAVNVFRYVIASVSVVAPYADSIVVVKERELVFRILALSRDELRIVAQPFVLGRVRSIRASLDGLVEPRSLLRFDQLGGRYHLRQELAAPPNVGFVRKLEAEVIHVWVRARYSVAPEHARHVVVARTGARDGFVKLQERRHLVGKVRLETLVDDELVEQDSVHVVQRVGLELARR